jgi:hypothetical protein
MSGLRHLRSAVFFVKPHHTWSHPIIQKQVERGRGMAEDRKGSSPKKRGEAGDEIDKNEAVEGTLRIERR